MTQADSPEEAVFRSMLEQADNFGKCVELANHVSNSQKEQALKKALGLANHYDEAIYVNMASSDPELQKQAITKAISVTNDSLHLNFWITRAPTDELRALAKAKLKKLKREKV